MPKSYTRAHWRSQAQKSARRQDWPGKLRKLREERHQSQSELARELGVSVAAVSHWETGRKQPDAASCIKLGKLAGQPDCWFWWERAGLTEEELLAAAPEIEARLLDLRMAGRYPEITIVSGPRIKGSGPGKPRSGFVMLPLLMEPAAAGRPRLIEESDVEDFFVFPRSWVPHPETTTLVRVSDNSMAPVIGPGFLVAVDASVNDPRKLQGKIVVAWAEESFMIRWLDRLGEQWALTPANESFPKHSLRPEDRILGRVAFWYGQQEKE